MTTMLTWSKLDKERMRDTHDAHMMDECYRWTHTQSIDAVGDVIESWTRDTTKTICGLEFHRGVERMNSDMTITTYDISIRLPYDFEINENDRLEVVLYRGEVASYMFEIVTPPQIGLTAYRVGCRVVTL